MTAPVFFTTSILRKPAWLFDRRAGRGEKLPLRVRVGYFHHPALGHTLIDTGYSRHCMRPRGAMLKLYRPLLGPSILSAAPLADGLKRLGLSTAQIDTVLLTHLHPDHIGGLRDLPAARVVVSRAGWEACAASGPLKNALAGVFQELLPEDIAKRLAFFEDFEVDREEGFDLTGDGKVVALPLPGHQLGHMGLRFAEPSLIYAADAQWVLPNLLVGPLPGFPLSLIQHDRTAVKASVERLRTFNQAGGEVMLCHDPEVTPRDIDGDVK